MIKHKQAIQSTVSAILLALFLTLIPLTFLDHVDADSSGTHRHVPSKQSELLSLVYLQDTSSALAPTTADQSNDISPLMGLLAGGFGVAVVGAVSVIVLRLGPVK
ncbi:MAG: hypothetical protein KDI79_06560 [Anaerolineae bacterium]|nr:hypothetical protein [Anaerolineae bacterium]